MFGVKDQNTKDRIQSYYNEREEHLRNLINNKPIRIDESHIYPRFRTNEEKYKIIIAFFVMLIQEEELYEFTPFMYKEFKNALTQLKQIILNKKSDDFYNIRYIYSEGCKLIKIINIINL